MFLFTPALLLAVPCACSDILPAVLTASLLSASSFYVKFTFLVRSILTTTFKLLTLICPIHYTSFLTLLQTGILFILIMCPFIIYLKFYKVVLFTDVPPLSGLTAQHSVYAPQIFHVNGGYN